MTILDWRDDSGMSDNLFTHSDRSAQGCTHSRCNGSKVGLLSTRINEGWYCWYNNISSFYSVDNLMFQLFFV